MVVYSNERSVVFYGLVDRQNEYIKYRTNDSYDARNSVMVYMYNM